MQEDFLVRQPKSLEHLAIPKIGNWIASQAQQLFSENQTEDELSDKIEAIRLHLDRRVPFMLHDKVVIGAMRALEELFGKSEMPPWFGDRKYKDQYKDKRKIKNHIFGRMTETFLYSKNLTRLSLYKIGTYVPSFSESYMLTGLTSLEILGYEETEVIPLLKELHNLKVFKYWHKCTNDVLSCLVDNCKLIEELSLSDIDDQGIHFLTMLPNLKMLIFEQDMLISEKGVEKLLLTCKNIELIDFHYIQSPVMEQVLNSIASSEQHAGKQFQLKSLDGASFLNNKQFVQMCPMIEEIRLNEESKRKDILRHVHDFQELRKLELFFLPICADVKELLQAKGQYLMQLKIHSRGKLNLNELMCINENCPNLENFTIHTDKHYSKQNNLLTETSVKNVPQLRKLKTLCISGEQLTDEELFFILSSCPKVENITIGESILLKDDIMFKVLEKNSLSCLKKITIFENRLSMVVIDQLVKNCSGLEVLEIFEVVKSDYLTTRCVSDEFSTYSF